MLVVTIDAQWEGMGDVGSARYELCESSYTREWHKLTGTTVPPEKCLKFAAQHYGAEIEFAKYISL